MQKKLSWPSWIFFPHFVHTNQAQSHVSRQAQSHMFARRMQYFTVFTLLSPSKKLWEGFLETARRRLNIESTAPLPQCCLFFFLPLKNKQGISHSVRGCGCANKQKERVKARKYIDIKRNERRKRKGRERMVFKTKMVSIAPQLPWESAVS